MIEKPLIIDYYTDVLCIWAWIAQRRIDELKQQLGNKIELHYHYIDVFGDSDAKIQENWADRGLYDGFSRSINQAAEKFECGPINPRTWSEVRPATSANAHLVIKAAQLSKDKQASIELALCLRKAFYNDAENIADMATLMELCESQGLDMQEIKTAINNGRAMAALMSDYQLSKQQGIKGSPSYVIDNGRQTLYGNVGYRVIHANIQELLTHPEDEASWC